MSAHGRAARQHALTRARRAAGCADGFVLTDNVYETVGLTLGLTEEDPLFAQKVCVCVGRVAAAAARVGSRWVRARARVRVQIATLKRWKLLEHQDTHVGLDGMPRSVPAPRARGRPPAHTRARAHAARTSSRRCV